MSVRSPMAAAVIDGLITSTVLSLLVVPTGFTHVDDFEQWLRRHLRHQAQALNGNKVQPSQPP